MIIKKIISGGQTGADQGGLEAAYIAGIPTGGYAPKNFKTEEGYMVTILRDRYGLEECPVYSYPSRTTKNVIESDSTVIFGNINSPGSKLTASICEDNGRPYVNIPMGCEEIEKLSDFIILYLPRVLNVAGNRESKVPGIQRYTQNYMNKVLARLKHFTDKGIRIENS